MRDAVLALFPARTHPLSLVSDPDGVLADESIVGELSARGFIIVEESDPVMLRLRVESVRPWSEERPLVIVTAGSVNCLPYDLWYGSRHVDLSLATFFPTLSLAVIRELSPAQRARLATAPVPATSLVWERTIDFVLDHVFGADVAELGETSRIVSWLSELFSRQESLPPGIITYLMDRFSHLPNYSGWPFERFLQQSDAFAAFMREQWRGFIQVQTGSLIAEASIDYILDFGDTRLQDDLAGLVRTGVIQPLGVESPESIPSWAKPGVIGADSEANTIRRDALIDDLSQRIAGMNTKTTWSEWQPLLSGWAELRTLAEGNEDSRMLWLGTTIEDAFDSWLVARYSSLVSMRLPVPHHLHHLPYVIALERPPSSGHRSVLLVLDGMSLKDWLSIERRWRARHPHWQMATRLVLAQIPTITSISRQALISGKRPTEFPKTIDRTSKEPAQWNAFWARQNLAPSQCGYRSVAFDQEPNPEIPARTVLAQCLIDVSIDECVHGTTNGDAEFESSLHVWLESYSPALERYLDRLLEQGFVVYVASDHGHVEARGIGTINDGVAAELKAKRARIYHERLQAESVVNSCPGAMLWADDGVLPDGAFAVLPPRGTAFTKAGDRVVTHGGASLDEVVVPFALIRLG